MLYTKKEIMDTAERVAKLAELMCELHEVEDTYLEGWLMYGIPDGATYGEIFDDCLDVEQYMVLYDLASRLLEARADEEDEGEDY